MTDETQFNVAGEPAQAAKLPDSEKPGTQFPHEQAQQEAAAQHEQTDQEHAQDTGEQAPAGAEMGSQIAQEVAVQDLVPRVAPLPSDGNPGVSRLTLHAIPVQPVNPDGRNRRSDDDALLGHFVDVIEGEFKGRFGAFERVLEHSRETGYPTLALVRTRDEFNQLLPVPYEHLRTSLSHGGR